MQTIRSLFILTLCGIMLMTQWACTSSSTLYLNEKIIQNLGTMGVTTGQFIPTLELANSDSEAPKKNGKGKENAGLPGGPPLGLLFVLAVIGLLILTGVAVHDLFSTPDDPQGLAQTQALLVKALADLRMQETFRDTVVNQARSVTPHEFVIVTDYGPQTQEDTFDYNGLVGQGLDTILELSVQSVGLVSGQGGDDLPFSLDMKVRARLVGLAQQNVIYDTTFKHRSEQRPFSEWADNKAQLFRDAIAEAYQELAKGIMYRVFFVEPTT